MTAVFNVDEAPPIGYNFVLSALISDMHPTLRPHQYTTACVCSHLRSDWTRQLSRVDVVDVNWVWRSINQSIKQVYCT